MMIKEKNGKKRNKKALAVSARNIALQVLWETERKDAYANLELNRFLSQADLSACDKNLATQLVYGSLRYRGTIDFLLSQFVKQDFDKVADYLRWILRLGVYQMIYLDKIPVHAIINEACEQAKVLGHQGQVNFVNGVLRNIDRKRESITYPAWPRDGKTYLRVMTSHPQWFVDYVWDLLGSEQSKAFLESNNQQPPLTARINTLKGSREQLIARLEEQGIGVSPCRYCDDGVVLTLGEHTMEQVDAVKEGLLQPQGESSMLVAQALSPAPGSMVMDLCAAPGGKTTHLAQMMHNQGRIIAQDVHAHKINILEKNCRRMGATIVQPVLGDSSQIDSKYYGTADYCLADVPCSGLGVLSHRPDIRWRKDISRMQDLAKLSRKILQEGAKVVKPGGILVFSTCTITKEENIEQLQWFLAKHPEFSLEPLVPFFPKVQDPVLQGQLAQGWWQTWPHKEGIDGFFMARLRKEKKA